MTRYALVLNKKGTILSFKVVNADPERFPANDITGSHFSDLIGEACRKHLDDILREISRTRKPGSFHTFFSPSTSQPGPIVEWTVEPQHPRLFTAPRFVLTGKDTE